MAFTEVERFANSYGSRFNSVPKVIVLHHTGGNGNVEAEVGYLQDNPRGVSIHVCITKDGTRYRMVRDENSAFHVGNSRVGNLGNPNHVSLGIELINRGIPIPADEFPLLQIESCAEQVSIWMLKFDSICMITPHSGIDTRGKVDPYNFPWSTFWNYLNIYLSKSNIINKK